MKHLKLFLEYTSYKDERINFILDKISQSGIDSLTPEEKAFLDAQKNGEEASEEALKELENSQKTIDKTFSYEDEYSFPFEFELKSISREDSNSDDGIITTYHGIMRLPDMTTGDGEFIEGLVEGDFQLNEHGLIQTNFYKGDYSDFDFCEGLEHEYDNFIQSLAIDLENTNF